MSNKDSMLETCVCGPKEAWVLPVSFFVINPAVLNLLMLPAIL